MQSTTVASPGSLHYCTYIAPMLFLYWNSIIPNSVLKQSRFTDIEILDLSQYRVNIVSGTISSDIGGNIPIPTQYRFWNFFPVFAYQYFKFGFRVLTNTGPRWFLTYIPAF